jgi:hypothetical protein
MRHHGHETARVIRTATFNRNVETLSRSLSATRP